MVRLDHLPSSFVTHWQHLRSGLPSQHKLGFPNNRLVVRSATFCYLSNIFHPVFVGAFYKLISSTSSPVIFTYKNDKQWITQRDGFTIMATLSPPRRQVMIHWGTLKQNTRAIDRTTFCTAFNINWYSLSDNQHYSKIKEMFLWSKISKVSKWMLLFTFSIWLHKWNQRRRKKMWLALFI